MDRVIKGISLNSGRLWLIVGFAVLVAAVVFAMESTVFVRPLGRAFSSAVVGDGSRERAGRVSQATHLNVGGTGPMPHSPLECHQTGGAYMGITYLPVTEVVAEYYGVDRAGGALITAVEPNSPADRAGLRPKDVIVEFGGEPVTLDNTLVAMQLQRRSGEMVSLTILRERVRRQVDVTLAPIRLD